MSEPRRGRRDNGLVAAEYAAAGDVDPRIGEHLLDVLALDGIAAYLRPSSDLHPVTRTATLPNRPTDRLYVDRTHLATARDYLARLAADADAPAEDASDDDPVWSAIVAGFATDTVPPVRPWPAAEDLPEPAAPARPEPTQALAEPAEARSETAESRSEVAAPIAGPDERPTATPRPPEEEPPSLLDALDTFGADLPDETDEGYTPPPPPPLPRPALPTVLGVLGVIGGLVVFLHPSLLFTSEGVSVLLGFGAIVAGFVALVLRLRPGDEDDDDPDDGARV
ncbi:MAG: DUF308 domain-containing protein [Micromonosporaceae bacterium]